MPRRRPEEAFERRVQKHLESHNFLVINCARSRPFDLVAIRRNFAIPIEVKARSGRYDKKQQEYQKSLGLACKTNFFVISQTNERTKLGYEIDVVEVASYNRLRNYFVLSALLLGALYELGVRDYTHIGVEKSGK